MSYCGLGSVVRCLRLWDVDNGAGHTANEDHRAGCRASFHEVFCYTRGEEVCAVHIDAPELLHSFVGVGDGIVVLGEAGTGDQMVDLAVFANNFGEGGLDGDWIGDVTMVSCDVGYTEDTLFLGRRELGSVVGLGVGVVFLELFDDRFCGGLGLFLWSSLAVAYQRGMP